MKTKSLKPAFAVLAIALAVAGCKSGGGSGGGDGGTGGGGNPSNDLVANTSGATAFAFLLGDQGAAKSGSAPNAVTPKTTGQFSGNNSYCGSLVKVVEVVDRESGEVEGYKTEKFFETYKDDDSFCVIRSVHPMRNNVILEGQFRDLATEDGDRIDTCRIVSFPLKTTKALPLCIAEGGIDGFVPDKPAVSDIYNIDVSKDGDNLLVSHLFRTPDNDGRIERALSLWSGDDFRTIFSRSRYDFITIRLY